MNVTLHGDTRPEAMADVPGVCEVPLTRAIVQYRDIHEVELAGGRIQDIGLALVLEGRYASAAEALDLGSADVKLLDLSTELVVLDWAYEPTFDHARTLVRGAQAGERADLGRFAFRLAMQVMERLGFGPLTRPSLLRIGFRDVCRDLDLNEATAVRIVMGAGRVLRAHFEYDANALVVRTATSERDAALEGALARAFPGRELRHLHAGAGASGAYQVRFALPLTLDELRGQLGAVRTGLARLLEHFEPGRLSAIDHLLETFGERDTLARLGARTRSPRYERVDAGASASDASFVPFGSASVH